MASFEYRRCVCSLSASGKRIAVLSAAGGKRSKGQVGEADPSKSMWAAERYGGNLVSHFSHRDRSVEPVVSAVPSLVGRSQMGARCPCSCCRCRRRCVAVSWGWCVVWYGVWLWGERGREGGRGTESRQRRCRRALVCVSLTAGGPPSGEGRCCGVNLGRTEPQPRCSDLTLTTACVHHLLCICLCRHLHWACCCLAQLLPSPRLCMPEASLLRCEMRRAKARFGDKRNVMDREKWWVVTQPCMHNEIDIYGTFCIPFRQITARSTLPELNFLVQSSPLPNFTLLS